MEKAGKKGKIPQQDWPSIIKRYEAGETLASIARTYECSPPAISYVLSRSRTREFAAEKKATQVVEVAEPSTLREGAATSPEAAAPAVISNGETAVPILTIASNPIEASGVEADPIGASSETAAVSDESSGAPGPEALQSRSEQDVATQAHRIAAANEGREREPSLTEPRRTLHLSMPNHTDQRTQTPPRNGHDTAEVAGGSPGGSSGLPARNSEAQQPRPVQENSASFRSNGGSSASVIEAARGRDVANFIDRALRERVSGDISAFLSAFDAALADDTMENRAGLREATDRLLRAGARTRIELERLEARVPLPARDAGGRLGPPDWRAARRV